MKKVVLIGIIILLVVYFFIVLGIELELKFGIEHVGFKYPQLIDTSFKIRGFVYAQSVIVLLISVLSIYSIVKKK